MSVIPMQSPHCLPACACLSLVLLLFAIMPGCIEIGAEEETAAALDSPPVDLYNPVYPDSIPFQAPITGPCTGAFTATDQQCTTTGGSVSSADPIPGRDVTSPAYRTLLPDASDSLPPRHYGGNEFFRETYTLSGNRIGLLANASEPPLTILFDVEPDCGNPNLCFFVLTVRDPKSLAIIAEEGYGRTYSSDPAKYLVVRSSGPQHLTLAGRGVTVHLILLSGTGNNQTEILLFPTATPDPEEDVIWF